MRSLGGSLAIEGYDWDPNVVGFASVAVLSKITSLGKMLTWTVPLSTQG